MIDLFSTRSGTEGAGCSTRKKDMLQGPTSLYGNKSLAGEQVLGEESLAGRKK
jgi:hypothetical protein